MNNQRIAYIDIAKAVAIISVVIGHVLIYDLYGRYYGAQSSLLQAVQSYQNHLFMFLSGMVAITTIEKKNVIPDIIKRFRSLIVPAIIIGVPYAYWTDANILIYFQNTYKWGYWYFCYKNIFIISLAILVGSFCITFVL